MTFDIGLHEVCVRVGVSYVITKFSRMDSLRNFVTHGAPLRALRARELRYDISTQEKLGGGKLRPHKNKNKIRKQPRRLCGGVVGQK